MFTYLLGLVGFNRCQQSKSGVRNYRQTRQNPSFKATIKIKQRWSKQKVGQGTGRRKGTGVNRRLVRVQADVKGQVSEDRCQQKVGQGTGRHKGTGFRRQV